MSQMLKSSGAMAGATMTSRVLGLGRDMVYAAFMDSSWVASAFLMAFMVPNLFRRLLGEGALTAAFIPIFKSKQVTEGETETWRCANAVISGLLVSTAAVTVLAVIGISAVLGFGQLAAGTDLMLRLLRVMFPYVLLVCLAATLIGMANARGYFFVPTLGASILNVVMIGTVLFVAPRMGRTLDRQVFALAIGVLVAGVAQVFFQTPLLRREGFRFRWVSPWREPAVHEVLRKMIPGSIGVAAFQINVLLIQCFAYWFRPSIVSNFYYSVRLMELPQGLFGISLATYLLPALSGLAAKKEYGEFRSTLRQGLGHLAFANLLATAIAISLAEPIVRLLFERGRFGPSSTHRVAISLACLAPGLVMFSSTNILARAFYALNDIKTPMKISIFCLTLNLGLALWLVQDYWEAGLGIANTLSACCNVGLLLYALRRKLRFLGLSSLWRDIAAMAPLAVIAGMVAGVLSWLWQRSLGHSSLALKAGQVFVPVVVAGAFYSLAAYALKVPSAREVAGLVLRRFAGESRTG